MMNVKGLLVVGILFHAAYLFSIFDIYFRSPLVHGMEPVSNTNHPPPARRLVLFVADGLRADRIFEQTPITNSEFLANETVVNRAPYLRSLILARQAAWGVSHTRVPTESRPGHVAVIAGFYEDVSAVTKGWKMNPVNFDSLFNQSTHTWSFGSPDILPMFKHGASDENKVETFMYSHEEEDFAKADASSLDTWTFDKIENLLNEAKTNSTLNALLRQDKIVIFLHMLGIDTNGHAHRPHSEEYIQNIKIVDAGVKRVQKLIENFYNDDKTSFIFTADHGMSDIGNHGDGNPDNTRTPLIAWGAGIQRPKARKATPRELGHDLFSKDWGLNEFERMDVNQADIATLMATLIGLPIPMNSVGVLPIRYLDGDEAFRAESMFVNAKQVLAQYLIKAESKRKTEPFFKPFEPLTNETHHYSKLVAEIDQFIADKKFKNAEEKCLELVHLCLSGLRYFQTYDWLFLRTIVSIGYLGWIVHSSIFVIQAFVFKRDNSHGSLPALPTFFIAGLTSIGFLILLWIKQSPALYYVYVAFPIYFWTVNWNDRHILIRVISDLFRRTHWYVPLFRFGGYILGLELLVLSYFQREILGVCFILMGCIWPWFLPRPVRSANKGVLILWATSCLMTAIFMALPVNMEENLVFITLGGLSIIGIGLMAAFGQFDAQASQAIRNEIQHARKIMLVQVALAVMSLVIVVDTTFRLRRKEGLPVLNQYGSWSIFICSIAIPFAYGLKRVHFYTQRLAIIFLAFASPMILLGVSYEALFYSFFSVSLFLWLTLERILYAHNFNPLENTDAKSVLTRGRTRSSSRKRTQSNSPSRTFSMFRSLNASDMRTSFLFLFFINVAFFGTGNVASLASFNLSSVYRFMTIFEPFTMGILLLLKIIIPFFMLSATFGVLSQGLDLPPFALLLMTLSTTDVMTMNFFYLVRDHGSWLEIGTSISHFVIASVFEVVSVLIFLISWWLVGGVFVPRIHVVKKRD